MNLDDRIAQELRACIEADLSAAVLPSFGALLGGLQHEAMRRPAAKTLQAALAVLAMTLMAAVFALPGILVTGSQVVHLRPTVPETRPGSYNLGQAPPSTKSLPPYSYPPLPPCGSWNGIVAYLVQLKSGVAEGSFHPAGFTVVPLTPYGPGGASGLVYAVPPTSLPTPASVLLHNPSVQAVGTVNRFPHEAQYLSCYYHLSDRPLAAPYVAAARSAFVHAGYVAGTRAASDLADYLHDDPLLPGALIVQVDYPGAPLPPPPGAPANAKFQGTDAYLCIENSAHEVLATGVIPAALA